jgi:hypothetical protein
MFSGVHVTRSLVLCVFSVERCLSICPVSFGHCVVCPSIYDSDYPSGVYTAITLIQLLAGGHVAAL